MGCLDNRGSAWSLQMSPSGHLKLTGACDAGLDASIHLLGGNLAELTHSRLLRGVN